MNQLEALTILLKELERLNRESDLLGEIIATFKLKQNRKQWRPEFLELIDCWINRYERT